MTLVNDAMVKPHLTKSQIPYAGMVVTVSASNASACVLAKGGSSADVFVGYTFTDTKDPITGASQASVMVGVVSLVKGTRARLVVHSSNAAITRGDPLTVHKTKKGYVGKYSANSASLAGPVIGYALEAVGQNAAAGTTVLTHIDY